MSEEIRITKPSMEYYRHAYHFSRNWDGKASLVNKRVLVYCEQGFGDIIQCLRYIPLLKQKGCHVILHAPVELNPVLKYVDGVDEVFDKANPALPAHDFHVLSLSLHEKLLGICSEIPMTPYINYPRMAEIGNNWKHNIGIAWEGNPLNPMNDRRCCPLKHFKKLLAPETGLFMLQNNVYNPELVEGVDFDIYSIKINDFGDVAELVNAMDYIVSVDTAVLHLAGAMGKRAYGILCMEPDPRWVVTNWYKSITLLKGDNWESLLTLLNPEVKAL